MQEKSDRLTKILYVVIHQAETLVNNLGLDFQSV